MTSKDTRVKIGPAAGRGGHGHLHASATIEILNRLRIRPGRQGAEEHLGEDNNS
jgi:hypothetical protein